MKPTEDLMHEHEAIKLMLDIMSKIASGIRSNDRFEVDHVEKIVDFLRIFADKCHHGKEEAVLFMALIEAGMERERGPVAVMLHEHAMSRGFVRSMADALEAHKNGDINAAGLVAQAMENYIGILQIHIPKENNVLFPLADKLLTRQKQLDITAAFEQIELEVVGHGIHEQYHELLQSLKEKYL
jgi:hemerythrin-like domain-containing protein